MKLMVLDGNSLINRSFYGIRDLTNREGLHTNAVFGFLTTLQRLQIEESPDALCVTFDVHAPTFRHKADINYKATRKPMPEELRMQMPVIKQVLDALNIPRYELAGWEADDLLGTISRKCEAENWECVVVTGDKDSLQLITEKTRVKLISTRMGRTLSEDMTPESFREKYGFEPVHMIDLKALMGDSSDNISGVPGIGEKTAMSLIQSYNSIDNIYKNLPDIDAKPGVIKKLTAGEQDARHSYWLAKIVTDAPLDVQPEKNFNQPPGPDAYPLFMKLEFSKLIDKFHLTPPDMILSKPENNHKNAKAHIIQDLNNLNAVIQAVNKLRQNDGIFYIRADDDLKYIVLYCDNCDNSNNGDNNNGAISYALSRADFIGSDQDYQNALNILFAPDIPKAGHNIKNLQRVLLSRDILSGGWIFDSELAAYLLDAVSGHYDLDRLCMRYGNFQIERNLDLDLNSSQEGEQMSLSDLRNQDLNLNFKNQDKAKKIADLDAEAAAVAYLKNILEPELKNKNLWDLYQTIELPLCQILAEMEENGCLVDKSALLAFGDTLSDKIKREEEKIYNLAGIEFNINSPKQLGEILFDKLSLPHGKKTKTGWSTNIDVLEKLKDEPIVGAILDYRQYAKLKSTYADGLLKSIGADNRIHTSFQMTATATGRLSSTEPNLQNIPTRTDLGSKIREMFITDSGKVLIDADYSQIELRILAHISGDETMCQAFADGQDIHTATAAQVFHVTPEEVTGEMRRSAKAVNFGIVYGISAFSLSQDIGVSVSDAKNYINAYFETFRGVRRYMENIVAQAKETGYVETLFHRRRELPELKASNFNTRSFGERVALNMPIQGTAADIMKLAMIAVWKRLKKECPEARLILQIHDELIAECPENLKEQAARILQEEMENVITLSAPLRADAHWGLNWLEAKG